MTGATILTRFTADTSDFDSKAKGVSSGLGTVTKGFVLGTAITKGLGKAFNMVSSNMDTAIDRFDILNNFPKAMKNLGQSTKDSQKAIDLMADKLTGLPTTLDEGALAVQRFTAKNGDVKKSADMFLAVNNAILAGGAPAVNQSAALEQLTQAYSRGKFDMVEWKSLQQAMPAQLKMVAKAMGYTTDELGELMRKGDETEPVVNEFIETIMRLNTEGADGLESFDKQARTATNGIRTSLKNFNNRIAQGLTKMIEAVNEGLGKAGFGDFAELASNAGTKIKEVLISLAPYITKIVIILTTVFTFISKHATIIKGLIVVIGSAIATVKVLTGVINTAKAVMLLFNAVMAINPFVLIIAGIVALVAGFIYLWKHSESFRNFWIGLWDGIKSAFSVVVNAIKNAFTSMVNNINSKISTVRNIANAIVNAFKSIPSKLGNIGKNIVKGLWNGMSNMKSWVIDKVKGMGKSILKGLKSALGVHSPSTEFALIGKFSVLGFTEQLDKMTKQVDKQVRETFSISPQLANSNALHYSPNVVTNVNINQTQDPLGRMVNKIKTQAGGARNDFNYGQGV